jgi:hypothetical protein
MDNKFKEVDSLVKVYNGVVVLDSHILAEKLGVDKDKLQKIICDLIIKQNKELRYDTYAYPVWYNDSLRNRYFITEECFDDIILNCKHIFNKITIKNKVRGIRNAINFMEHKITVDLFKVENKKIYEQLEKIDEQTQNNYNAVEKLVKEIEELKEIKAKDVKSQEEEKEAPVEENIINTTKENNGYISNSTSSLMRSKDIYQLILEADNLTQDDKHANDWCRRVNAAVHAMYSFEYVKSKFENIAQMYNAIYKRLNIDYGIRAYTRRTLLAKKKVRNGEYTTKEEAIKKISILQALSNDEYARQMVVQVLKNLFYDVQLVA